LWNGAKTSKNLSRAAFKRSISFLKWTRTVLLALTSNA
jgi:hypothetical protein